MARRRNTRRSASGRSKQSGRKVGRDAVMIWVIVALTWGYTAWALYSTLVRKRHVHIYDALLLVDVAFLALAIWMTIEWRRSRRG